MGVSRSKFSHRLSEFPEIVLRDIASFAVRARWNELLAERMGSRPERIVFEVGCFDASFLCKIARKHPGVGFIGLDWKAKALFDGASQITQQGINNVLLIRGRGQDIAHIFAPEEVDEIWLLHPDPCDKPNELQNRLFSERFLVDAHGVLRDEKSTLTLKTDHPGYYQYALALFGQKQPELFESARRAKIANEVPKQGLPRVRARDVVEPSRLPPANTKLQQLWKITVNSSGYWNDPIAQQQTAQRLYFGETTTFESRFKSKRQPIYLLELRPRGSQESP